MPDFGVEVAADLEVTELTGFDGVDTEGFEGEEPLIWVPEVDWAPNRARSVCRVGVRVDCAWGIRDIRVGKNVMLVVAQRTRSRHYDVMNSFV